MVVKPAEGKYETVRSGLDEYIKKQEELWNTYLPDQYELVKNRLVVEEGDYLIYIISEDNNSVLEAIKSAEVK